MRLVEKREVIDRRGFLGRTAGTAALLAAAPVLPGVAQAALKTGDAAAMPTLVKMARDLYPHDMLPDSAYETAVVTIDGTFSDGEVAKMSMGQGVAELNDAATKMKGKTYLALDAEADRVAVLMGMQQAGSPFFKAMRSGMVTALYNQEGIWKKFGYEGSSAEKGGYLHRGFNDLDWLT